MSPTNTENLKEHLGEAGSHLKQAATAAGGAIKGATGAATSQPAGSSPSWPAAAATSKPQRERKQHASA